MPSVTPLRTADTVTDPPPPAKRRRVQDTGEEVDKQLKVAQSQKARQADYMERMGVKGVPDTPLPKSTSRIDFSKGLFLAPMVRIGTLPTRLISLEHGADLVWSPEIVDRAIIGTDRVVDNRTGIIRYIRADAAGSRPADAGSAEREVFSTHPIEKPYMIFQLGSATPALAYAAVSHVAQDVAGVDLNCGCPKPFSTHGGMGSNLLSTPDLLCDILVAMRKAAPSHVSVTCKIRLLPTQEETLDLVKKIVRTSTVDAITVHCRTKEMRPREKALSSRLIEIAQVIKVESAGQVPVVVNGDCWDPEEAQRIMDLTGVTAAMIARGAESNPSVFRRSAPPLSVKSVVAPAWVRYALALDNPFGNTKYCMNQLAIRPALQPAAPSASKKEQSKPVSKPYEGEQGKNALSKADANTLKQKMAQAKSIEDMAKLFNIDPVTQRKNPLDELLRPLRVALEARQTHHHI
ncbi:FMN-linked oxidoreductase [Tilletiaria anomala UBC 951]|uniref:FMN-linked oxidoreductase n=1 Tax=Tilletiaria anomala (strain ATCC 24038 / CBS 436.72 / UBC 951) TaxID=1037660 RepID=A0A066WHL3_TILAU|nr:FMN-linked oxidoreductase [Tilletiaria anomala UBC 951]KDN53487.1 FMN-linked oxidoreductase [Tilletiaria anomala UBC 951]